MPTEVLAVAPEDFFPLDEAIAVKFIEGLTSTMMHPATPDVRPVEGYAAGEGISAATMCMTHQVLDALRDCNTLLRYDGATATQKDQPRVHVQELTFRHCVRAGKFIQENHTPEESQAIAKGIIDFVRAKASAAASEPISSKETYEDMKLAIRADSAFQWLSELNDQGIEGFRGYVVVNGIMAFINAMRVLEEDEKNRVVEAFMGAYKPVMFIE